MSEIAIKVMNISKMYRLGSLDYQPDTLRDQITHGLRSLFGRNGHHPGGRESSVKAAQPVDANDRVVWALQDVCFEVRKGEVIGIIGGNGAGKSTLLKILSRITEPTRGRAQIRGRVGSLLEVGTGFHPELSGRENIYMNGAILGMRKVEIERKFDEIVAFSEIGKFMDTPVKRYSSGMYVRLAFAVAAHMEPEVLMVDEVLAVGDAGFQRKCLGKLEGVAQGGRTVIFVSHNMAPVEHLCDKVLVLEGGKIVFQGDPKTAIDRYMNSFSGKGSKSESHIIDLGDVDRESPAYLPYLKSLELFTGDGKPLNGGLRVGDSLTAGISFSLDKPDLHFDLAVAFDNHFGQRVFTASSAFEPDRKQSPMNGDHKMVCHIPSLTLLPGEYRIRLGLDVGGTAVDRVNAARINVLESDYYGTGRLPDSGLFVLPQRWYPAD